MFLLNPENRFIAELVGVKPDANYESLLEIRPGETRSGNGVRKYKHGN